jgi:hypothetical protein
MSTTTQADAAKTARPAVDDGRVDPVDEQLVRELAERARAEGVSLTGPGGLLGRLTKVMLESALEGELEAHLGYRKHDPSGDGSGNSRNGHRAKTVLTEAGPVEIEVPWDRASSFEPVIVPKRQRRLGGIDDMVISLVAKGLTTGEVQAHRRPGPVRRRHRPAPSRPGAAQAARAGRLVRSRRRGEPQRPRHHRGRRPVTLAVPRRPARTADQRRETYPAARRARDQPPPGPQHGTVPARRRGPRRHPRPHSRRQHRCRRHLAASVRRRLGGLRCRGQPPTPAPTRSTTSRNVRPATTASAAPSDWRLLTILPPDLPPTALRERQRQDRNKALTWEPPYGIEP